MTSTGDLYHDWLLGGPPRGTRPDPLDGLFELLMARIRALEADTANLREEMACLRSEGFEEANEDCEMQCGGCYGE